MYNNALILLLTPVTLVICTNINQSIPDYDLRLEERIAKDGYPIEIHQIITEDGYILATYRIPHGLKKKEPENKNKSAILIAHGMGGSPNNFIILGKERSAPYYFADRGMDVWLFSARASDTPFEKQHVTLDWNKDAEFWSHSYHELGIYDLASTIDFILNCTGQEKVTLIGHSAGGSEFFALLSEKPEYNQKVKLAIAWGSAAIIRRLNYPMMIFGIHAGGLVKALIKYFKMAELLPGLFANFKSTLIEICLKKEPLWYNLLKFSLANIGSHNSILTREEYSPMIISNLPRMSSKQILHFLDNVYNGTFRKYDYGAKGNLKRYGRSDPPNYNLSAVTAPIAFFNAGHDGMISLEDVYESIQNLPNAVFLYRIPFYKFTHTDYIFAYNATEMVYEPTLEMIRKIDNGIVPSRIKIPSEYIT